MKQLITLGICLLVVLGARAQRIDYDNSSKWFMGVNVGGTWNSTDVSNQVGGGWGLTLGKSYNYNYGRRAYFDIRARYLGGKWYGQDYSITDSVGYTSGPLKPYFDTLGYAVNNFQTELHSLSLELVLHANGIRERSGWDPYIFGGIGFKWFQTYGDLFNQNDSIGGLYDYGSLGSDLNSTTVSGLVDGIYETALEGSEQNKYSFAVMPSLGFGLGYQIGKRVTLGLEHKTTFTLMDNFDGFASTTPRAKNDLYHYTSLYLQFRFRTNRGGGGTGGNSVGNIDNYNNNNTNNLTNCDAPLIVLRDPSANIQLQGGQMYTVKADITRISGRDKITFMHNGIINNNFTYDPTNGRFESNVVLAQGTNSFEFKAVNGCGTSTSSVSISNQICNGPNVVWTNPPTSGTVVFNPNITLSAQLANVNGRENIVFKHNGVISNAFVYNPVNGTFESNVNLVPGQNIFEITASNACGIDVKPETVVYQNCLNPIVTFVEPVSPNTERTVPMFTVRAKIDNISNANQVQFRFNGVIQSGGTYNANTKIYMKAVSLIEGGNTFEIIATNNCGSVTAVSTVIYKRASAPSVQAPAISLSSPTACPVTVNPGNMTISGRVERITSANQLSITVNGQPVNSFSPVTNNNGLNFSFNLNAQVNVGSYTVNIVAVNQGGSSSFTCTITVQQPVEEQKITICHYPPGNNGNPQTIEIPLSAWPAHQAHGDKLGPCPEVTPEPTPEQKIVICHYPPGNNGNPQTIEIPLSAWPAHQAHGDKLGPCPEVTPEPTPEQKIVICHYPPGNNGNPQTIEIPLSAWPAHQAHGDKLGPCPEVTPEPTPEQKIVICHYPPGNNGNPQTIEIPLSAWPAHQAHGDKLGPCPEVTPEPTPEQKIKICHYPPGNNGNPQTIEIPLSAWPAHQAHGDRLGECPPQEPGNGNQGGNGQGNGNSGNNGNQGGNNNQGGNGNTEEQKIKICHYPPGNNGNPQTIEIPLSAWPAHQAHGDRLGECPPQEPGNGNQGGNGQGNGNSGNNGNQGGNNNQGGNGNTEEQKIKICHYPPGNNGNPQTIEIPLSAWPAHQAHGDRLGECPPQEPGNGNQGGNGQGNGNSGNNGNQGGNNSQGDNGQGNGNAGNNGNQGGNNNQGGNGNTEEQKIKICHYPPGNNGNPQTIEIPLSAWPAHQAHGDQLGECPPQEPGNGNQGGNGQGNGNSGNNGNQGGNNNQGGNGQGNGNAGNNGNQGGNNSQGGNGQGNNNSSNNGNQGGNGQGNSNQNNTGGSSSSGTTNTGANSNTNGSGSAGNVGSGSGSTSTDTNSNSNGFGGTGNVGSDTGEGNTDGEGTGNDGNGGNRSQGNTTGKPKSTTGPAPKTTKPVKPATTKPVKPAETPENEEKPANGNEKKPAELKEEKEGNTPSSGRGRG
jgi:hypothetical protein